MATADRVLAILELFTLEEPVWTVDALAHRLGLSASTAYGYVRSLVDAELLVAGRPGLYAVGPAVISLDRLTRRHDALVNAAREPMRRLAALAPGDVVALLCRSFRGRVMCVDQYSPGTPPFAIAYERGRPMPLYRGAASKAILAHLPLRTLRHLWKVDAEAIGQAGLGSDWATFRRALKTLRTTATVVTRGELDAGLIGISAPVFGTTNEVIGSFGLVALEAQVNAWTDGVGRCARAVEREAAAISESLLS